ncbi:hypothetical protein DICVIV_10515 [Dictyocaulus viviparus]|uniref:DEAD/DEAH-box helicase domain-containing protein n=1 Tax=Dictyocaulus viviparus TaxID=29172 RepID=A0A0D8XM59_DICVI|nr:hypothetical protein DICVIV_10515 [Dictyocaulus viviparus]
MDGIVCNLSLSSTRLMRSSSNRNKALHSHKDWMTSEYGNSFPKWVPPEIIAAYSDKNIEKLFDWQTNVLEIAEKCSDNVVYSAPTSAGKSIVAELIALRVAMTGKKVLFLLPYISMARERMNFLQVVFV